MVSYVTGCCCSPACCSVLMSNSRAAEPAQGRHTGSSQVCCAVLCDAALLWGVDTYADTAVVGLDTYADMLWGGGCKHVPAEGALCSFTSPFHSLLHCLSCRLSVLALLVFALQFVPYFRLKACFAATCPGSCRTVRLWRASGGCHGACNTMQPAYMRHAILRQDFQSILPGKQLCRGACLLLRFSVIFRGAVVGCVVGHQGELTASARQVFVHVFWRLQSSFVSQPW
jgi:hypothetical protein